MSVVFFKNSSTLILMKILRVSLQSSDSLKKILHCLKHASAHKIVFECPRGFLLFSDISVLKKIKESAEKYQRTCVFVTQQSFLKKILTFQNFTVHDSFPETDDEVESCVLDDFLDDTPKAQKNPSREIDLTSSEQKKKTSESSDPPSSQKFSFVLHSIESDEPDKKPIRGKLFFAGLALIGILIAILLWISPKAIITLKPEVSVIPITQNFIIQLPGTTSDKEVLLPVLQGIYVENEVKESQTFPTTGKRYELTNAYGSVTLFNETNTEKFLVPSRLSTADGVIVRFSESVTIPPKQGDEPGTVIVQVVADEYDEKGNPIGHRGNVPAGTDFIFPALREELQELYYARANRGPLVGGSTLTHYFMADDDIAKTKEFLEESFRQRALEKLRQEIKQRSLREKKNYVLIDHPQLLKSEVVEEEFPEDLIGAPVETFDVYVHLTLKGLVFDQQEVLEFLKEKIQETQDARKKLIHIDDVSADYSVLPPPRLVLYDETPKKEEDSEPELLLHNDENQVKISVQMKGIEMFDFYASSLVSEEWRQSLKNEIAGKTKQEALGILTNFPEIENVSDIYVAPFWSDSIPHFFDKIEFVVEE